ncbi:hypothetical protein [Streptantibioticus cattleyicolor]|uniref:Uncharacterized protein n=1 Tax=Streptantibioticus cattleyicolor (strain ATCC 35852 / DSM 46488 / JCM 4925 / NBRC 14057 / NRRL 8057) TaxID=1003195 RepID=F8JM45_STREN|nr:hypothetical protein [Streptantibioticus cattleyicolor]AEW99433.1 hypothetical protein SCATT_p12400 [Streptantibioticus cattleyicolor NRRL 8057 = DSM 46488]CCB71527.1 conserved protein of unknown function [Streptantibioticus cattleyicolor NRRL 8057 = DSM 46488]
MVDDPAREATATAPCDPFAPLRAVADAVLYEGYLLYPYRRSSPKNRVRWQFGVLGPRAWAERNGPVTAGVAGSAESWYQQTQVVLQADPDAVLRLRLRYLHSRHKSVERRHADGSHRPVASLEADGELHLTFDEALPRETGADIPLAQLLAAEQAFTTGSPGGTQTSPIADGTARVVRRGHPVHAVTTVRAQPVDPARHAYRLTVRTENTGEPPGPDASRDEILRHALIATHTLLGGTGVAFVSLLDPPDWAAPHVRACRNLHTFPVLGGAPGTGDLMLSAPIILPDHPQVAPESPGDLHDAAEIDEILSLRTALLTEEEKREARATDVRAARILDRVDTMPPEVFARLHGAIRSLRPRPAAAWWEEGGDDGLCPATDSVRVGEVAVARGSRVRLRPGGRGADAQDMFLAGRDAKVAAVLHDVDGTRHLAVTLEDDPGAELNAWYGRYLYFRPHEIEPLATTGDEEGPDGRRRAVEA